MHEARSSVHNISLTWGGTNCINVCRMIIKLKTAFANSTEEPVVACFYVNLRKILFHHMLFVF